MKLIPSKTFLLGEYVAMYGGPALVALTEPCFAIDEKKTMHPDCMASIFWKQQTGESCLWGLSDPHLGKGGLGASSAEFLLAYRHFYDEQHMGLEHLHQAFTSCSINHSGQRPSGYDVLAQTSYGCALIESKPIKVASMNWQLDELGFILVHTHKKLATHQHLKDVRQELNWQSLMPGIEMGCEAFLDADSDQWLKATTLFYNALLKQNLVSSFSHQLIQDCMANMPILAAKGCGALGADVVVLYVLKEKIGFVRELLLQKGLDILATHHDLYLNNHKN